MIETIPTDQYPTRYAAFAAPGRLAILTPGADGLIGGPNTDRRRPPSSLMHGGRELAVFAEPMPNAVRPHLTDGIYLEVIRQHDKGPAVAVSAHASAPTLSRRQWARRATFDSLEGALAAVPGLVAEARAWCVSHAERERAIEVDGRAYCVCPDRDGWVILRPNGSGVVRIGADGHAVWLTHAVSHRHTLEALAAAARAALEPSATPARPVEQVPLFPAA